MQHFFIGSASRPPGSAVGARASPRRFARPAWAAVFLACSLPYVVSIMLTGNPFEVRLWVPLLLGVMLVQADDGERAGQLTPAHESA